MKVGEDRNVPLGKQTTATAGGDAPSATAGKSDLSDEETIDTDAVPAV